MGAATYGTTPSAELRWTGSNYDAIEKKLSVVTSVGEAGGSPGNLQTTVQGGTYGFVGRTSGAAPQVTALAALILSVNNTITPTQVKGIIEATAEKNWSVHVCFWSRD